MDIAAPVQDAGDLADHGLIVPLIVRGQVIETDLVSHRMRGAGGQFLAPDIWIG